MWKYAEEELAFRNFVGIINCLLLGWWSVDGLMVYLFNPNHYDMKEHVILVRHIKIFWFIVWNSELLNNRGGAPPMWKFFLEMISLGVKTCEESEVTFSKWKTLPWFREGVLCIWSEKIKMRFLLKSDPFWGKNVRGIRQKIPMIQEKLYIDAKIRENNIFWLFLDQNMLFSRIFASICNFSWIREILCRMSRTFLPQKGSF